MQKKKILVVDDSAMNLELMEKYLAEEGYDVRTEQDPRSAVATVAAYSPDAIVMDIIMPGIRGDALAKELKSDPATGKIPVILITADLYQEKSGLAADFFVRRPVIGEELVEVLKRLFAGGERKNGA